jgi:glycogen operon protein
MPRTIREGSPSPPGATWDGGGVNFSLFSTNATRVQLCLFDQTGAHEVERIDLPGYTDEMWHGYVPDVGPGTVYGYRVDGPYDPEAGHRFNAHKLLLDPYARAHVGQLMWDDSCFGYTIGADDLMLDARDSAPFVPKGVVIDPNFEWRNEVNRTRTPWDETILYELHVRGYTMQHQAVQPHARGTFAGLSAPAIVEYLRALGITSVELLPVHAFINDRHLVQRGLTNYWGYNSIGFFAPDVRYAADPANSLREFKEMVARLHDAGLEVILDVVYNHTAEGNELGPTLSFKGIDNAVYYRLIPDRPRYYRNDAGTGNTLDLHHRRVTQLVMDSLRYWVTDMHVDGFRFDLGTVLARDQFDFDDHAGFLIACSQDPVLAGVKLIAEPWDCGPGGYQVGGFPPGWAEWNDTYRDTVRDFWRGASSAGPLAAKLCASSDLFNQRGRKPWASVNFVTTHDGFTLNDLVSYDDKHNDANGDNNQDGHADNRSSNYGAEGPSDDPEIIATRHRQMRNFLATLLCAQGTPMLLGGDEFGRTQQGNNNAYCQDNAISWIDWRQADAQRSLTEFTSRLVRLRRQCPVLRQNRFLTGEQSPDGLKDVKWLSAAGHELTSDEWADHNLRCFGMLIDGRALAAGAESAPSRNCDTLLILMNAEAERKRFTLPSCSCFPGWSVIVDTARPEVRRESRPAGKRLTVDRQSIVLLQRRS